MTSPAVPAARPEQGQPGNLVPYNYQLAGKWESGFYAAEPADPNPALRFPQSAVIFDQMVRTDPQVGALFRLVSLYLRRANWQLVPGTKKPARPEVLEFVRGEIGLPEDDEPDDPDADIIFKDHLNEAVRSLQYGFAVFEKLFIPNPDGTPGFHLKKLATRPQRTIMGWKLLPDGELVAVLQTRLQRLPPAAPYNAIATELDAPWLVVYCHDKEGADWSGQSILRAAYKPWLLKDMLLRVGAQTVERNGMGIPIVAYDPNMMTPMQAENLARGARSGATAGIWYPKGAAEVRLEGVTGSTVDPLPWVKLCNEEIAASALAMFITLGHDSGARALATTFVDAFTASLQAVGDFLANTFTSQVIRDIVRINFGPTEVAPRLTCGDLASDKVVTAVDMKSLADAGLIVADDTLEAFLRRYNGLPEKDKATEHKPAAPVVPVPPYDGVNPLAPVGDRINQPIPPSNTQHQDIPVAAREYLDGVMTRIELMQRAHT